MFKKAIPIEVLQARLILGCSVVTAFNGLREHTPFYLLGYAHAQCYIHTPKQFQSWVLTGIYDQILGMSSGIAADAITGDLPTLTSVSRMIGLEAHACVPIYLAT